jgi:hypothetical protein
MVMISSIHSRSITAIGIVGPRAGGMIAQAIAIEHPGRAGH